VVKKMLRFYCRDCQATFESEPDGTGYEQAPCPACGDICMTVQFEQEEQERHNREATVLSFVGQLTGSFKIYGHHTSNSETKAGQGDSPPIPDAVTVCNLENLENLGEANTCCELLGHLGIQAQLVQVAGTSPFLPHAADSVAVQVPSGHIERAKQIMDEYHSIKERRREAHTQDGPITFECEECGAEITCPADRRGYVEICPHCREYVDVPE